MTTNTKNTLREECTNCNNVYLTNMEELKMTWVSLCPTCKKSVQDNFTKAVNEFYAQFKKVGA